LRYRFLLASAFSVLYLLVLAVFYTQDKVDGETLFAACAIVAAAIFGLYGVFRLGLNLRFPDPSLTAFQLLAAVFTMLFVVYRAPETRLAFTAFFFVALMFGMLAPAAGSSPSGFVSIGLLRAGDLACYADNHDAEMLRLDASVRRDCNNISWLVFIGGRVKRLQRDLVDVSGKLVDIEEKARHDDLTGVYNRRALMVAMEEAKQRAQSTGEPLSICVIDLDSFKRYNDEFDHLTGDQVLRIRAGRADGCVRRTSSDGMVARSSSRSCHIPRWLGAMLDAERLHQSNQHARHSIARSIGPLTVSVGVAQCQPWRDHPPTFARPMRRCTKRNNWAETVWNPDAPRAQWVC
jgi:diguanylate cyclase (GGDEF)-like protein